MAKDQKVLRNKIIPLVKVLWKNHSDEEATWEREEDMRQKYPNMLFFIMNRTGEGRMNFEDEILVRGGELSRSCPRNL